jgi:uncharacterized phage infection (PIP) family protein YhgE
MNDDDFAELFKKPEQRSAGLGENLGEVLRTAWQRNGESNEHMRELQDSLNSILSGVNSAIDGGVTTPEAQQAREQLTRVAETIRQAAERASQEMRPELLKMLRQANAELRRFTENDKE